MKLIEYNEVKYLNYLSYCDYLQKKYGIPSKPYFNENYNKNKISRTDEGLLIHHKCENKAIMLSTKEYAIQSPYDYQLPCNLIYCDYLEHLFLHILISEEYGFPYGIGGVIDFLIPELNDYYSGFVTSQEWRQKCHKLISNQKDVYFELVKRFVNNTDSRTLSLALPNCRTVFDIVYRSYNSCYGTWDLKNNFGLCSDLAYYITGEKVSESVKPTLKEFASSVLSALFKTSKKSRRRKKYSVSDALWKSIFK